MNVIIPGFDRIDAVERPVFSLITEATLNGETASHRHRKAQLLYVVSGVLTVLAAGGVWTVPPGCALWIPAGTYHTGKASGPIKISSLYLNEALGTPLEDRCGILFVQPLLRELIHRFDGALGLDGGDGREARLAAVLVDELKTAPLEPIYLPLPSDRRLRRLVDAMLTKPDSRFTIEEWGAQVGASQRTLRRLFQRETGLSFTRWRQQLHVGLALQRLASGDLVNTIAGDLGYESVSAFIAMFRRMLGTTPSRFFQTTLAGTSQESAGKPM